VNRDEIQKEIDIIPVSVFQLFMCQFKTAARRLNFNAIQFTEKANTSFRKEKGLTKESLTFENLAFHKMAK
jgi:hypothetical protein